MLAELTEQQWNCPNAARETDRHIFLGYTGAMAPFMATGDPNARNLTANATLPALDTGYQFHVRADGFGQLKLSQRPERCALWKRLASGGAHVKHKEGDASTSNRI